MSDRATKPLGAKCYGSICHLPGSRLGPGDHKLEPGMDRILTVATRDRLDTVVVTEKLDGSNVGVWRDARGYLVPLMRAGYHCADSHYEQHRLFATYVAERAWMFSFLEHGWRACGEWLAQTHGTRYALEGRDPFVVFDVFNPDNERVCYLDMLHLIGRRLTTAPLLHYGGACSVEQALDRLGKFGWYGAQDAAEGCVWRVERKGEVDFLAKYVRPNKVDGSYLVDRETGQQLPPVWNWRPSPAPAPSPEVPHG